MQTSIAEIKYKGLRPECKESKIVVVRNRAEAAIGQWQSGDTHRGIEFRFRLEEENLSLFRDRDEQGWDIQFFFYFLILIELSKLFRIYKVVIKIFWTPASFQFLSEALV